MKKTILSLIVFLIISIHSFSQYKCFVDQRIQDTYSQESIEYLIENNPNEIKWLNWYLDNCYNIRTVGVEKCKNLEYLRYYNRQTKEIGDTVSDIDGLDMNDFNVFLYNTECRYDRATTYRIGNTGKTLVIKSRKYLNVEYNKLYNNEN